MAAQEDCRRPTIEFPRTKDGYVLSTAASVPEDGVSLYKLKSSNDDDLSVGVKILNIDKVTDFCALARQIHEHKRWDHPNIAKVHCSFVVTNHLWIITSPLSGSSLRSIIRSSFPAGLRESTVAFVLKETLKGLKYLHGMNKLHEGIGANCIFLDDKFSSVKLAFRSMTREDHDRNTLPNDLPNWMMAPELLLDTGKEADEAAEVWMFGLLALELCYGRVPAVDYSEFRELISGMGHDLRPQDKKNTRRKPFSGFLEKIGVLSCLNTPAPAEQQQPQQQKMISRELEEMAAACLSRDAKKRPTLDQLMDFALFKNSVAESVAMVEFRKLIR